jgi:hypothetical protein
MLVANKQGRNGEAPSDSLLIKAFSSEVKEGKFGSVEFLLLKNIVGKNSDRRG